MKKNLLIISIIFVLPIFAYFVLSQSSTTSAKRATQITSTTPVIMKFSSSMCIDCKRLGEVVKKVYPKYEKKVILESIMVESNDSDVIQKIKKHKVVLVPTLVFIDSQGRIVKKTEGYIDEATFEKYVKELINGTLS